MVLRSIGCRCDGIEAAIEIVPISMPLDPLIAEHAWSSLEANLTLGSLSNLLCLGCLLEGSNLPGIFPF